MWKCGNKQGCDTGKGYPWASWNEDEFDNALKKFTAEQTPEVVEIEDLAPEVLNDSIRELKATVTTHYN